MTRLETFTQQVLVGRELTSQEAQELYSQPLEDLCQAANEIRRHFCGWRFDLCTIFNGKSGRCSEDCRFCAQSARHHTGAAEYPLLSPKALAAPAKVNADQGVLRYSIVTSGKRLSEAEVDCLCEAICLIRAESNISVCVSAGLLKEAQYRQLKQAGADRVHNNLETSRRYFPSVCTTHTFDDKLRAIWAARAAGLTVCSGGIMGLGETVKDRIDMALTLRDLGIQSVPINLLNPIPGTPLEENQRLTTEDMRRIVAVYRFLLPEASIRLAGGRGLLEDKGLSCFRSGANAAISGDMLTTAGITVETDLQMLEELGYEVRL